MNHDWSVPTMETHSYCQELIEGWANGPTSGLWDMRAGLLGWLLGNRSRKILKSCVRGGSPCLSLGDWSGSRPAAERKQDKREFAEGSRAKRGRNPSESLVILPRLCINHSTAGLPEMTSDLLLIVYCHIVYCCWKQPDWYRYSVCVLEWVNDYKRHMLKREKREKN